MKPALAVVLTVALSVPAPWLQAQGPPPLTIDLIMQGPQFYGYAPQDLRWSGDGQRLYFRWKQASERYDAPWGTWVLPRAEGAPRRLSDEEARLAPPVDGATTRDGSRTVFARDGDLYLYDWNSDQARRLTRTEEEERDPHFTQDETRVAFTRGGNLFVMPLAGGPLEQLTHIQPAGAARPAPKPPDPKTSQGVLQLQEAQLLAAVRDRVQRREEEEARRRREHPREPFVLEAHQSVVKLQLAPDGKSVVALIEDGARGDRGDDVPNYVTESSYTEMIKGRSNVGDAQENRRVLLLDVETGAGRWVDLGLGGRSVWQYAPVFNEAGTRAVMLGRANDNKDRWIFALDLENAKAVPLFAEHDPAWIGGPGYETLGWVNDEEIYFVSERDGWAHLYTMPARGGSWRQVTTGRFEVESVQVSRDRTRFYLTTSEESPAERHFYEVSVSGGPRTRITHTAGKHEVTLTRDESYVADVYSYVNRPPEIYTGARGALAYGRENARTHSPAPEFWQYSWLDAPIVQVPARDGALVPARLFQSPSWRPGGPAVIFVHGAGYLQNVHKYWSPNYPREFLFHHYLMEHGYLVLDLDYRASAGYGRDWRTAIYRHMGGKDLEDNVDGARYLVEQHGADPRRIGIYGGSYGGFLTLMAMFTTPEVFAAGAALRPVTDWSHYNHGYTSNILNTPQEDEEAFRRSSPIFHAEGLKGALLLLHGMVDTNVFFQDTVRLVQRLIELRKENWSVAFYPVEDHAFQRPESWADEYKRIFKLFEENLKR
jgi:dipeptidyl aminopeptidase/acylaminoacyl peptidase